MATIERPIPAPPQKSATPGATPPLVRQKSIFLRSWVALLVLIVGVVAHIIGWQVAEIDPPLLVKKAPDAMRIVNQLLHPDILSSDKNQILISVGISGADAPTTGAKPVTITTEQPLKPDLIKAGALKGSADTTEMFKPALTVSADTVGPGQMVTISGSGFRPNSGGEIVWQFPGTNSYPKVLGTYKADASGAFSTQVETPTDATQVVTTFPNSITVSQAWDVGQPYLSDTTRDVYEKIIETIFLALMGTTFAVVVSIPLSFLAARNLMAHSLVGNVVYYVARTILNVLRAVEALILATVFVAAVGIGPFAGVLALMLHSIASLGKLYSEAIESIDAGPIEAITATGANRLQVIMYAVVPQFIPQFISFTLYRWDINVRMSTILGFVGGGGIGFILIQYINLLLWERASVAIIAIAIVVIIMDWASAKIREKVI